MQCQRVGEMVVLMVGLADPTSALDSVGELVRDQEGAEVGWDGVFT